MKKRKYEKYLEYLVMPKSKEVFKRDKVIQNNTGIILKGLQVINVVKSGTI